MSKSTLGFLESFVTAIIILIPCVFNDVNGEYIGIDGEIHKVPRGHSQYEKISGWDAYGSTLTRSARRPTAIWSERGSPLTSGSVMSPVQLPSRLNMKVQIMLLPGSRAHWGKNQTTISS